MRQVGQEMKIHPAFPNRIEVQKVICVDKLELSNSVLPLASDNYDIYKNAATKAEKKYNPYFPYFFDYYKVQQ
jgi:hypothetical protein